jgi:dihydrolipoamide dehydrogenase
MLSQIPPAKDDNIAKFARAQFRKQGFAIQTSPGSRPRARSGCRVVAIVENGGGQADVAADAIVVAAGVQGNVDGLRLEDLGVRIERGLHRGGQIRPD